MTSIAVPASAESSISNRLERAPETCKQKGWYSIFFSLNSQISNLFVHFGAAVQSQLPSFTSIFSTWLPFVTYLTKAQTNDHCFLIEKKWDHGPSCNRTPKYTWSRRAPTRCRVALVASIPRWCPEGLVTLKYKWCPLFVIDPTSPTYQTTQETMWHHLGNMDMYVRCLLSINLGGLGTLSKVQMHAATNRPELRSNSAVKQIRGLRGEEWDRQSDYSPPATKCCMCPCCTWLSNRHDYTHGSYPFWPRVNSSVPFHSPVAVPAKHCILFLAGWGARGSWNQPTCSLGIRGQKHKRHQVAKNPRRSSWDWCCLSKRWHPRILESNCGTTKISKIGAWKLDEIGWNWRSRASQGKQNRDSIPSVDGSLKRQPRLDKVTAPIAIWSLGYGYGFYQKNALRYLASGRTPGDNPESPPKQQGETKSKQAAKPKSKHLLAKKTAWQCCSASLRHYIEAHQPVRVTL
jgi:hypothetical protein